MDDADWTATAGNPRAGDWVTVVWEITCSFAAVTRSGCGGLPWQPPWRQPGLSQSTAIPGQIMMPVLLLLSSAAGPPNSTKEHSTW